MIRRSLFAIALAIAASPALAAERDIDRFTGTKSWVGTGCYSSRCVCAAEHYGEPPHNFIRNRLDHRCAGKHLRNDPQHGGYWYRHGKHPTTTEDMGKYVTGHYQQDDEGLPLRPGNN